MRENYTLTRLYIDQPLGEGVEISLSKDHLHYVATVLRMSSGAHLRLFNGRDGEWQAEITDMSKRYGAITVQTQLRPQISVPDIWLCFAPIRRHRNGFILEKATELGVSALQPVHTGRTQHGKLKLDKLQTQIVEASEQTERLCLPELRKPLLLSDMLDGWPTDRTLVMADEGGDCPPALEVLGKLNGPAALLIGPEGGFTPHERQTLRDYSFVEPVSLGPRILRADTAALSLLTLWQSVQGDWVQ